MMMDGNRAQKTSSRMVENFILRENDDERYALLKVIPGRMKRNRNNVETANCTGRYLAQFPHIIHTSTHAESFSLPVNVFIDIDEFVDKLAAFPLCAWNLMLFLDLFGSRFHFFNNVT
jgi:hypothetical protein